MNFLELAKIVLEEENKPLTTPEIWNKVVEKGLDKKKGSKGLTPWNSLAAILYVNVKKKDSEFICTQIRPAKFTLKKDYSSNISEASLIKEHKKNKKIDFFEKDLHPFLTYFCKHKLNCYTKTIHHSPSTKKEFGEWVHPDMIGCYFPIEEWEGEVFELSSKIGNKSIRLFSFEIKRNLSLSNLRESFFQTVSNSSWANESYLVTENVSSEPVFMNELSRLSTPFGIGVIKLNVEDPNASEILLPSKFKENLDWETINKLVKMNPDFKQFVNRIKIDISSKEIRKEQYDNVLEARKLKMKKNF